MKTTLRQNSYKSFSFSIILMIALSPNSCVEILTPKLMDLELGAFEEAIHSWKSCFHEWHQCLFKNKSVGVALAPPSFPKPSELLVATGCNSEEVPRQHWNKLAFDIKHPTLGNCEEQLFILCKICCYSYMNNLQHPQLICSLWWDFSSQCSSNFNFIYS